MVPCAYVTWQLVFLQTVGDTGGLPNSSTAPGRACAAQGRKMNQSCFGGLDAEATVQSLFWPFAITSGQEFGGRKL